MEATPDPDVDVMFVVPNGSFAGAEKLKVNIQEKFNRDPLPNESDIEKVWNAATLRNPALWNGTKFRLHSINQNDREEIVFNLGITSYKEFIGTNWSPDVKHLRDMGEKQYGNSQTYMSDALGVGALVVTSDNQIILIRRSSSVGEANGLYDIPGGHPEPQVRK